MRKALTKLSLFSGIGGDDLASEWAGIKTLAFCERDAYCRKVLAKHWPGTPIFKDVRELCRRTWMNNPETDEDGNLDYVECTIHPGYDFGDCPCVGTDEFLDEIGQPDIIAGGFPCVDITSAKNAVETPQGIEGEDSGLWREFARIVGELGPDWVVVENSSNLNVRGLETVIGDLAGLRYSAIFFPVSASFVGAPHRRRRTFVVAHSNEQGLQGNVCEKLAREIARRYDAYAGGSGGWSPEPNVGRVAHGVPRRVDRLRALGNAVVPEQIYPIYRAIVEIEQTADREG